MSTLRTDTLQTTDSSFTIAVNAIPTAATVVVKADLANTSDPTKGSALVGRVYRQVDTVAQLKTLPNTGTPYAEVLEYFTGAGVINARYHLDLTDVVTADNGVTVHVAADGGRWKLKVAGPITLKMAGGLEDGTTDDLAAWNRFLAVLPGKSGTFEGVSMVSGSVVVPANNITLRGASSLATIKAINSTNFEYTFQANSRSGLVLRDFTVDSNRLGRVAALTTRTVSVSLSSCTDCNLFNIRGINAIGSASIPGIGISTAGVGLRVNTTNCTAVDCGIVGKAADGFFCSSSQSVNTGNVAINCLDTGHVIESCSYTGNVNCVAINCGVVGAITNAIGTDTYGCYSIGMSGQDWNSSVTGGFQVGALAAGNLIETTITGLTMIGVANFIGPGVNVRRTSTGRVDGLTLEVTVRNGSSQGVLLDSVRGTTVRAKVAGVAAACVQVTGDSDDVVIHSGTNLIGGTHGVIAQGTSKVLVNGIHSKTPSSYGVFAFDTSVITSTMNDIVTPGVAYEGKDAGATLNRVSLVNGLLSIESVTAGAPLTATLSSKFTLVNKAGATAGVVGLSAT